MILEIPKTTEISFINKLEILESEFNRAKNFWFTSPMISDTALKLICTVILVVESETV